jgi:hypothetical protein
LQESLCKEVTIVLKAGLKLLHWLYRRPGTEWSKMMKSYDYEYEMGDHVTLKELAKAVSHGFTPIVEVEAMDGIYTVRLHHANGVSELSDEKGRTRTFTGTGEIQDELGGIGLKHGVLTFSDQCGDEFIGVPGHALTPDEMLAHGTRIAFR